MSEMSSGRCSLVVFDWDGTLMDSEARIVRCFQASATDLGEVLPDISAVRSIIGLNLETAYQTLYPGLPAARISALSEQYRLHFLELNSTPMPYYPGVLDGLRTLAARGVWMAVATGKARRGLERALEQEDIRDCFITTRCGDEVLSKPHPQMLLDILDYTGKLADQAMMVGDTLYDLQMAAAAGVSSLGVSYGVQDKDALMPLASLGVVDSFAEVMSVIDAQIEGAR